MEVAIRDDFIVGAPIADVTFGAIDADDLVVIDDPGVILAPEDVADGVADGIRTGLLI